MTSGLQKAMRRFDDDPSFEKHWRDAQGLIDLQFGTWWRKDCPDCHGTGGSTHYCTYCLMRRINELQEEFHYQLADNLQRREEKKRDAN